jgi:stearoyl-CoA desaturase (delta-9 desaturase)
MPLLLPIHPLLPPPFRTFTWRNAAIGYLVYAIPGIFGITLCYHRMLTHRSFKTYK